jgi:hypothetical protein
MYYYVLMKRMVFLVFKANSILSINYIFVVIKNTYI